MRHHQPREGQNSKLKVQFPLNIKTAAVCTPRTLCSVRGLRDEHSQGVSFLLHEMSRDRKTLETGHSTVMPRADRWEGQGLLNDLGVFFWGEHFEKFLELEGSGEK